MEAPNLEFFAHGDLKPSSILAGAGIDVGAGVSPAAVIEAGLPAFVVRDFALAAGMTIADIGPIVGTSDRTLSRKIASGAQLGAAESDRAYRLFNAVAEAVHAFGDVAKALRWIHRSVPALDGHSPIALLRTEIGTRQVLSAIDSIAYGGVA